MLKDPATEYGFFTQNNAVDQVIDLGKGDSVSDIEKTDTPPSNFHQMGRDLLVVLEDGTQVLIQDYFIGQPVDLTFGGAVWRGQWIAKMAQAKNDPQFAQAEDGATLGEPIGTVENFEGNVTVVRANGIRESLETGDKVFQGDMIETGSDGAVGIVLADLSVFSLGEDAQIILDEMVYDPGAQEGNSVFSLLSGAATFVSGQIAKIDPDAMVINTPVATIGIRGTKAYIEYDGENIRAINMLETTLNGQTAGEIVISSPTGQVLAVSNSANEAITWNPSIAEPQRQTYEPDEVERVTSRVTRKLPQTREERAVQAREEAEEAKQQADEVKQQLEDAKKQAQELEEKAEEIKDSLDEALSEEEQLALEAEAAELAALAEQAALEAEALEQVARAVEETVLELQEAAEEAVVVATTDVGVAVNSKNLSPETTLAQETQTTDQAEQNEEEQTQQSQGTETGSEDDRADEISPADEPSPDQDTALLEEEAEPVRQTDQEGAKDFDFNEWLNEEKQQAPPSENKNGPEGETAGTFVQPVSTVTTTTTTQTNTTVGTFLLNQSGSTTSGSGSGTTTGSGTTASATGSGAQTNTNDDSDDDNTTPTGQSGGGTTTVINPTINLAGQAIDGYIANARVFIDLDDDRVWDSNEAYTFTDASGNYTLTTTQTGTIVVTGGTDIDTGLSFAGTLTAPEKATSGTATITPLTSLIQAKVAAGSTLADAQTKVKQALGLTGVTEDLTTFDPFANSESDAGKEVMRAGILIANTIKQAVAAFEGKGASTTSATEAVFKAMASTFSSAGGEVDLTQTSNLTNVLNQAATEYETLSGTPPNFSTTDINNATAVMSASNTQTRNIDLTKTAAEIREELKTAALIAQRDASAALKAAVEDPVNNNVSEFNDVNTLNSRAARIGTAGNDTLTGSANADKLDGFAGNDTITGNGGDDVIDGGAGTDRAVYASSYDQFAITTLADGALQLADNSTLNGSEGTDVLKNIEEVRFGSLTLQMADQTATGGLGDDVLSGTSGGETLNGYYGDDTLDGAGGADTLFGHQGDDVFIFQENTDFNGGIGTDTLRFGTGEGIDFTANPSVSLNSIEVFDLANGGSLLGLTGSLLGGLTGTNSVSIEGDASNTVSSNNEADWTFTGLSGGYYTFTVNTGLQNRSALNLSIDSDIQLTGINSAPVASVTSASTDEDTAVEISSLGTDANGETLTVSVVSDPSNGSYTISSGTITYTPNENITGADSFTYRLSDGFGAYDEATVTLTINPVNDLPVLEVNGGMTAISAGQTVLSSDMLRYSDPENEAITFTLQSDPDNGTLEYKDDGVWYTVSSAPGSDYVSFTQADINNALVRYSHNGQADQDIFTFTVSDPNGTLNQTFDFEIATDSVLSWTGATDNDWGTGSNWYTSVAPLSGEDVYIFSGTPEFSSGSFTTGAMHFNAGTLTVSGGTFSVGTASDFGESATLALTGGTFAINGDVDHNGAFIWSAGTLGGSAGLDLLGTYSLSGSADKVLNTGLNLKADGTIGAHTITGAGTLSNSAALSINANADIQTTLNNASGATLSVSSISSSQTNSTFDDLNNAGTLVLDNTYRNSYYGTGAHTYLTVGDEALNNTGTIQFTNSANASNGTRYIVGAVDNLGTLDVDWAAEITNTNTTFNMASGAIDFAQENKTLTVVGGTTQFGGATSLSGTGTLNLTGTHILDVTSGYTHSTATADLHMGGAVSINSTAQGSFTTTGALVLRDNNDVFNVDYINAQSGATRILSDVTYGDANVTFNAGFSNAGDLELDSSYIDSYYGTGRDTYLSMANEALINTGTIEFSNSAGASNGVRYIVGSLTNQGRLDVDWSAQINNTGETFDTSAGLIEYGTLNRTLTVSGGTTKFGANTSLTGTGTLSLAGTHSLDITSGYTHSTTSVDVSMTGAVTVSGEEGSAFNVTGALTLKDNNDVFNVDFVNAQGGATKILSDVTYGDANVTFNAGFSNAGDLELDSSYINSYYGTGRSTYLTMANEALINTGTIEFSNSAGASDGVRYIVGSLTNQGRLDVDWNAQINNTGETFDMTAGLIEYGTLNKTLTVLGGTTRFGQTTTLTGTGMLKLSGTHTLDITDGYTHSTTSADLNMDGAVTVSGDTDTVFTVSGELLLRDNNDQFDVDFVNAIGATTTIETQSAANYGQANLTFNAGLRNAGVLALDSTFINAYYGTGDDTYLTMTNEALINAGRLEFNNSSNASNGTRYIVGSVTNEGTLDVDWTAQITNTGATFDTTQGTIDFASHDKTLTISGGTTRFSTSTTLSGTGTLSLAGTHSLVLVNDYTHTNSNADLNMHGVVTVSGAGNFINDADMILRDNNDIFNTAFINNQGATATIQTQASTSYGQANLTFNAGLSNAGTLVLDSSFRNAYYGTGDDTYLTMGDNQVLTNSGTVQSANSANASNGVRYINADTFDNQGTLDVDWGLTFNKASTTLNNTGVIDVASGRTLSLSATGAALNNLTGGRITGFGTIALASGTLTNAGIIDAGGADAYGTLTINGDVELEDAGTLRLHVGSEAQTTSADRLVFGGNLAANGSLEFVELSGGDQITAGDSLTVLQAQSMSGAFDSITGLDLSSSLILDPTFNSTSLSLTARTVENGTSGSYLVGSASADSLSGNGSSDGSNDVIFALGGDDIISISSSAFNFIDGGDGTDILDVETPLDLTSIRDDLIQRIEVLRISNHDLTLTSGDVLGMTEGTNAWTGEANALVIIGSGDGLPNVSFNSESGWGNAVQNVSITGGPYGVTYTTYTHTSGAKVYLHEGGATEPAIAGTTGDDTLNGTALADYFYGAGGNDSMDGGAQIDTVQYDGAQTDFTISDNNGVLTVTDTNTADGDEGTDTLSNIEILQFLGDNSSYSPNLDTNGTLNDDTLYGGINTDVISGGFGNDTIYGGAGDDQLSGYNGDDILYAGAGNDTLHGENGADTLIGGFGNDSLDGGGNDSSLDTVIYEGAWAGYQLTDNGGGSYTITDIDITNGDEGTDTLSQIEILRFSDQTLHLAYYLRGGSGDDTLVGAAGDDSLFGSFGNDLLQGNDGADQLYGYNQDDTLIGGAGDDSLDGGNGADTLIGGFGNDSLDGGGNELHLDLAVYSGHRDDYTITDNGDGTYVITDTNTADGDEGTDTLSQIEQVRFSNTTINLSYYLTGGSDADRIVGSENNDSLNGSFGIDTLIGGVGDDILKGYNQDDTLEGGAGDDTLDGQYGADTLIGGSGNDSLNGGYHEAVLDVAVYGGSQNGYSITDNGDGTYVITDTDTTDGDDGIDTLSQIERLQFGDESTLDLAYYLTGTSGDDTMSGTSNNDSLNGSFGNDTLDAGSGSDILNGYNGDDVLVYNPDGADTYEGGSGQDTLLLQGGGTFTLSNNPHTFNNLEVLNLVDGNWILSLQSAEVGTMTDSDNSLIIMGDQNDSLEFDMMLNWTDTGTDQSLDLDGRGARTYSVYTNDSYSLVIDDEISQGVPNFNQQPG